MQIVPTILVLFVPFVVIQDVYLQEIVQPTVVLLMLLIILITAMAHVETTTLLVTHTLIPVKSIVVLNVTMMPNALQTVLFAVQQQIGVNNVLIVLSTFVLLANLGNAHACLVVIVVCTKDIVDNSAMVTIATVMECVIYAVITIVLQVEAVVIGVTLQQIVTLEIAPPVTTTPVSQRVVRNVGTIYVQPLASYVL